MRICELNHVLEDGRGAYPGLPEPRFGALLTHEASRANYRGEAEFFLGKVEMAGNTGTYIDSPFHRYRDGVDLGGLPIERVANLPGVVLDGVDAGGRSVTVERGDLDLRGNAVLVRTGRDSMWGSDEYWESAPFLSPELVAALIESEAALVGVDFGNVDDTGDPARPVHTTLLGAGIPICENLCRLGALPPERFRFFAVPLRIAGCGSFPVRAFAIAP